MRGRIGLRAFAATTLLLGLVAVVVGFLLSWKIAGDLVSPAMRSIGSPPADIGAAAVLIASESGSTLHGWHARRDSSRGVVVLLHGFRDSRLAMIRRARMLHGLGYSTLAVDFQAHGESPGKHITVGYLERFDVRAAVEYARTQHPGEPIGVIGVSLGGAAALLASPLQIDALVLESVYPTITDAIRRRVAVRLGALADIPCGLLFTQLRFRLGISPDDLRPIDHMGSIDCPVFVMSGAEDIRTTADETRAMFVAARQPKILWMVPHAAHEDLCRADSVHYRQRVGEFLMMNLRAPSARPAPAGMPTAD